MIRRLHAAGARAIVYDVQFTEPMTMREDLALYRAIKAVGGAVLATSESDGHGATNVLGGDENLERVGARAAASDLLNDRGGAVSRFPREVAGLETLAVATAERVGDAALEPSAFGDEGAWIDYRGPPGTIRTVSFSDVLRGRFAPHAFRDRVVVVGASAPTLRDVHGTPIGGERLMLVALAVGTTGTIASRALVENQARRRIARDNEALEARVRDRTAELWSTQLEIAQRLAVAVEWRDAETGLHVDRIGRFRQRLALAVGLDPQDAELLRHASALRDRTNPRGRSTT